MQASIFTLRRGSVVVGGLVLLTGAFSAWLAAADYRFAAATVLIAPMLGFAMGLVGLLLRARARAMLARLRQGRSGTVGTDGVMAFHDDQWPCRLQVQQRVRGPAVVVERQGPRVMVEPGCRGESLVRWRGRVHRWSVVAVMGILVALAPLLAAWVVGLPT